jgi:ribonuclease D
MTNYIHKNDLPLSLDFKGDIAIDTETMGLKTKRDRICLVQVSSGDGNAHLVQFSEKNYDAPNLKKFLQDEKILKIFHFARFDLGALKHYLNVDVKNIYCTKIASKLVRTYSDKHGLKALCEELLKIEISKKQQSSDWGNPKISENQIKYASCDVLYLHRIKYILDEMLEREGRKEIFQSCIDFLEIRTSLDLLGFDEVDIFAH